ncbi:MAG: hypothetical protein Fur0024_2370 [Patescibacteria group bacterium]
MLILVFIIVVSLVILFHELGHYIFAKKAGAWVQEFGLGIPPRIFGKKFGETIYSINLLPIGAFVKVLGEGGESDEEVNVQNSSRAISSKTWSQRAKFILGGIFFNIILAFVLIFIGKFVGTISLSQGAQKNVSDVVIVESAQKMLSIKVEIPENFDVLKISRKNLPENQVENLSNFSGKTATFSYSSIAEFDDAEKEFKNLGLKTEKDFFDSSAKSFEIPKTAKIKNISLDGKTLKFSNEEDVKNIFLENAGKILKIKYENKDGKIFEKEISPNFGNSNISTGLMIFNISETRELNPFIALLETIKFFLFGILQILFGIFYIFQSLFSSGHVPDEISSVVGIYPQFEAFFYFGGWKFILISFPALLSLNLAIANLLPIPALDGGHFFFLLIEKLRGGKKLKPETQNIINLVGFAILITFLIFLIGRDVFRLTK